MSNMWGSLSTRELGDDGNEDDLKLSGAAGNQSECL